MSISTAFQPGTTSYPRGFDTEDAESRLPFGLTTAEVESRRKAGQGNDAAIRTSRSYGEIIRFNLLNPFNVILFVVGMVLIALGRFNDAFFSVALVLFNCIVGTIQEIRAKRKLDEIALLTRPKVTAVRDGIEAELDPAELVAGDFLLIRPGDQVVVDGTLVTGGALEVDESLLTGESDAVRKQIGDTLLSGSFCVTGQAYYTAEKVGTDSYANKLTATARQFKVVQTPLQREVNLVLRVLTIIAVFLVAILFTKTVLYAVPAVRFAQIAAIVMGIISAGLLFTIILAYALGAVRLLDKGALVQQSNAIESLSHVDVLCTDKTGTLTTNQITFDNILPLGQREQNVKEWLGHFAASVPAGNQTIHALRAAFPGSAYSPVNEVPFSSARKWSALSFHKPTIGLSGSFILGAPEMLQPYLGDASTFSDQLAAWTAEGLRVLLFAHNSEEVHLYDANEEPALPSLTPLALISFRDELRPQVQETIAGFSNSGIDLKIISGDHPETVTALARQAGLPMDIKAISGNKVDLAEDMELEEIVETTTVFGRITPEQKQRLVEALRRKGHYVAMIGDGVNDVLSLKTADVGVAMQSGSGAARGVADIILLNDSFGALVPAFREGQRIVSGMGDIMRVYLPRLLSVALMINILALLGMGFPTVPTQEAFTTILTVGIPTILLTIWAKVGQPPKRLLPKILPFISLAMVLIAIFGTVVYGSVYTYFLNASHLETVTPELAKWIEEFVGFSLDSPDMFQKEAAGLIAQSALTLFRALTGIFIILFIAPPTKLFAAERPISLDKRPTILAGLMLILGVVFVTVPGLRSFFGLEALTIIPPALYGVLFLAVMFWFVATRFALKKSTTLAIQG
ncbi:MAG: HAD-IC family P-type ATPase [Candidatus Promineifilaceae bacterium]